MKLIKLKYSDGKTNGWDFSEVHLQRINLFVGATGSGKTRMLNLIFNIATFVNSGRIGPACEWTITLSHEDKTYRWRCSLEGDEVTENTVAAEEIVVIDDDKSEKVLVTRDKDTFKFKDTVLPRLSKSSLAISILKEEPDIAPLARAFRRVARRNFFSDELEKAGAYGQLPADLMGRFEKEASLETLFHLDLPLNIRLFLLKEKFPKIYKDICSHYKAVFPNIEQMEMLDWQTFQPKMPLPGKVPAFGIREKGVAHFVPINELSSGMQKVLLILTDLLCLPGGVLYMIDEYENSLGVNAIDFLPPLLNEVGGDNQFVMTTHHPYLINQIPVKNWLLFHRHGMAVSIRDGASLESRFGRSKQKAFTQLINDPLYLEGVE